MRRKHVESQGHGAVDDGHLQAMVHSASGDEILKNSLANNAFENFEIAAYNPCSRFAAQAREPLETSLKEEPRMAA
jgi:ferritin-like metal-binding protein YciE